MSITEWLMVSGDFMPHGGMDICNLKLAEKIAETSLTHLVSHRIDKSLHLLENVRYYRAMRPLNSHLIGEYMLAHKMSRVFKQLSKENLRVIANGGNWTSPDVNWVHYVHAAFEPRTSGTSAQRLKCAWHHRRSLIEERRSIPLARHVVCNSHLTAAHVSDLLGVREDRISVVYLASDVEQFSAVSLAEKSAARKELGLDERPWCLFIGDMTDHRKGFDTLLNAWQSLVTHKSWDGGLVVVGREDKSKTMSAKIRLLGLSNSIKMFGFRKDVPRILAACDLLVHPARYEAYGLSVQEAICRGVPVIVSKSSGVSERFPAGMSHMVLEDANDSDELVERLLAWHSSYSTWIRDVSQLSEELRSYTYTDMTREFLRAVAN